MGKENTKGMGITDMPCTSEEEDLLEISKYVKGLGKFIRECQTPMSIAIQEMCIRDRMRGIALNDIVLTRRDVLQVLNFQVYLNGVCINEYMADGIIAATPTGSTCLLYTSR